MVKVFQHLHDKVIRLIRSRSRIGVKRSDPFLTMLLVAAVKSEVHVVCVDWGQ